MYSGVPTNCPCTVRGIAPGRRFTDRAGDTEVDDLRRRHAVHLADQHIGRLEITVDHALLVGVVHCSTDADEELDALADAERALVAVTCERRSLDEVHREKRPPVAGGTGIEHAGKARVVHPRQHLPFRVEPRQQLPGVHSGFHDLERHRSLHGNELLGAEDDAETAFAERLEHVVVGDLGSGSTSGGASRSSK